MPLHLGYNGIYILQSFEITLKVYFESLDLSASYCAFISAGSELPN
jgi:hypothetical protein